LWETLGIFWEIALSFSEWSTGFPPPFTTMVSPHCAPVKWTPVQETVHLKAAGRVGLPSRAAHHQECPQSNAHELCSTSDPLQTSRLQLSVPSMCPLTFSPVRVRFWSRSIGFR